jgi:CHAD domain-containing protein
MGFQLKAEESVEDGIKRSVRHEIEKALKYLGASSHEVREDEAVHETRKCFKAVRAALRLVREPLGDAVYRDENRAFRDASRPLTEVRDAQMLVEAFDALAQTCADQIDGALAGTVHDALLANQQRVARRVLAEGLASSRVKEFAAQSLARVAQWQLAGDGWAAIAAGLRRVYRAGHRALARAAKDPSSENLHEWRKQTKYLWQALRLITPALASIEKDLDERYHELSRLLGDDHDLVVLHQTLAADPLAYGGQSALNLLFAVVDARRAELQRQAFALGRQLYADPPKSFTQRMAAGWQEWIGRQAPASAAQPV